MKLKTTKVKVGGGATSKYQNLEEKKAREMEAYDKIQTHKEKYQDAKHDIEHKNLQSGFEQVVCNLRSGQDAYGEGLILDEMVDEKDFEGKPASDGEIDYD